MKAAKRIRKSKTEAITAKIFNSGLIYRTNKMIARTIAIIKRMIAHFLKIFILLFVSLLIRSIPVLPFSEPKAYRHWGFIEI